MTEEEFNAAIAERDAEIDKLKTDKHTALGEKNKANAAAKAAQEAADQAAQDAAEKAGNIEAVKASLEKKHAADLKKATDANAAYEKRLSDLLIDNAINESIAKNGVLPHFVPAVTAMLKAGATMKDGEAIGPDGGPFNDHLTTFYASNDAKHFVAAPANSGAGATGSTAKASNLTKAPETAEEYNAFMKLASENPAEANALADKWGVPDLKV